jgi:hypothetical protein
MDLRRAKDRDEEITLEATLRQQMTHLENYSDDGPDVAPVQLALAYMAVNELEKAIKCLGHACDQHDPRMAWLHLWPILDPLRDRGEFKALVNRMGLPSRESGSVL